MTDWLLRIISFRDATPGHTSGQYHPGVASPDNILRKYHYGMASPDDIVRLYYAAPEFILPITSISYSPQILWSISSDVYSEHNLHYLFSATHSPGYIHRATSR